MNSLKPIDITIIKELLRDGRKSFTALAKECNTSKDIVWKHYRELQKAGIIVGATLQNDSRKFGYSGIAMLFLSVESQSINEVAKRLEKACNSSDYYVFRYYNSEFSLAVVTCLRTLSEIEYIKQLVNKQTGVNEIKTLLWTDCRNNPENILSGGISLADETNTRLNIERKNDSIKLDQLDHQIVEKLVQNGRLPFSGIAEEIGSSTYTVTRRYERLVKANYIKACIQVNPVLLGFQAILELHLSLSDHNEVKTITDELCKIPGVSYILKVSGDYDLIVVALVKDCKDIISINEEIAKIRHIKNVNGVMREIRTVWPTIRQHITTF